MKDKRYSIQKVWGGNSHKVFEVRFANELLGTEKTRYLAEQVIAQHKKERTQEMA